MMEGWKTDKFKNQIQYKSGYTWSKEQELKAQEPNSVRVLTVTNIQKDLDLSEELYLKGVNEKDKKEKAVSKDWCIAVSSNGNRKRIGNAVFIKDNTDYLFASFLTAFKPKDNSEILPDFFFRWLSSHNVQERITSVSEGTTGLGNLDIRYLRNMDIHFPDKSEQTAIAAILSKVDEAIAAVQGSIAAAERLKKSLMQNLLTGRMKPDGTLRKEDEFYVDEKFGRVPKGWKVKAIGDKSVCKINPNYKYKKKEVYDFVPMEAVKENFGGLDFIEKQVIDNGSYTRFKAGDILFAKITPCSENGKVAYIEHIDSEIGFASTEFIVFHPTDNVNGQFIYLMLASENVHRLAISLMEGTTGRQRIPWKIFRNRIFVPMPDKEEQNKIVEKILVFDKKISYNYNKIAVLEKLKKSLMQNLLTGRVRVK